MVAVTRMGCEFGYAKLKIAVAQFLELSAPARMSPPSGIC